jgi:hypothetical protein
MLGMVGCDDDAVGFFEQGRGKFDGFKSYSFQLKLRNIGIVILNFGVFVQEYFQDFQSRGFAKVIDVLLIAHAENKNAGFIDGFAFSVKLFLDFRDPEFRHLGIDLGCKLNEARAVIQALHFPGQINRVNRYAMSAGSGTGTKSHKAKRLGGCGVNHLQGIDPELVADDSDFIDQSDIDLAKCVSRSLVISATVGELTGITLSTIC